MRFFLRFFYKKDIKKTWQTVNPGLMCIRYIYYIHAYVLNIYIKYIYVNDFCNIFYFLHIWDNFDFK